MKETPPNPDRNLRPGDHPETSPDKLAEHFLKLTAQVPGMIYQFKLRPDRRFVGSRDTGEILECAGSRPGIKALGITSLTNLQRRINEHFDKPPNRRGGAGAFPVAPIRRNQRHNTNHARLGKQPRHFAHAPDIFLAIFRRKPEIRTQAAAQTIAIQHTNCAPLVPQ